MNAPQTPKGLPQSLREELERLKKRANAGDQISLKALRELLEKHPEIWEGLAELAVNDEWVLIAKLSQGDAAIKASVEIHCAQMRQELLGADAGRLEQAAVDQVICCWLETQVLIRHYSLLQDNLSAAKKVDTLRNSAQRRYDGALRSLSLVQQKLKGHPARGTVGEGVRLKIFPIDVA